MSDGKEDLRKTLLERYRGELASADTINASLNSLALLEIADAIDSLKIALALWAGVQR